MLNMRASRDRPMLVSLLAAATIRRCSLGLCVTLKSGSTFSRYTCQGLKMSTAWLARCFYSVLAELSEPGWHLYLEL